MVYRFFVVAFVAVLQVLSSAALIQAQTRCDSSIVVSGWVFELGGGIIPAAMAVNKESGGGVFVERDGSFLLRACPGDTIVFGAIGFYSVEKEVVALMKTMDIQIDLVVVIWILELIWQSLFGYLN